MPSNPKSDVANFIRSQYGIPLSESDDDVIAYAHTADPDGMSELTKTALMPPPPSTMEKVGSAVGNVASKAIGVAGNIAEHVPGLKEMGELGALSQKGWQMIRDASQNTPFEMFGNMMGGYEPNDASSSGMASMLPNNALGAGLMVAPALSKGLGALSEAVAPEASGSLLRGKAAKNAAAGMKAFSGTPEMNIRAALADPSMLKPGPSVGEAGEAINQFANQPEFGGLKTGSEARAKMGSVQNEISPRTGTGHNEANSTWQRMGEIEEHAAKMGELQDRLAHADEVAEDLNNASRQSAVDAIKALAPTDREGALLRPYGAPDPQLIQKSLIAQAGEAGANHTPESVSKITADHIESLKPKLQKNLQDLISARSVASSLRSAPGLAAPTEVVDAKLATQNMNRIDEAIGNTMDALKPGSGEQYSDLVNQYHRAKVRESFAPLFAQNANGSPSVLRIMAALQPASIGLASGSMTHAAQGIASSGLALAAESPAMQARAIRAAAFLKDVALNAPSKTLGVASKASSASERAVGPLNSLMAKKDESSEQGK